MTFKFDGYNYLVRLDIGEQLVESLTGLIKEQRIKGAWVSGVGGALNVELGYYHLDTKQYEWKKFDETLEVVSLNGTVAWMEGEPALHFHGVFSRPDMTTAGGHVKDLKVGGTLELFVHVWNAEQLTRSRDDEIGLKLLDL